MACPHCHSTDLEVRGPKDIVCRSCNGGLVSLASAFAALKDAGIDGAALQNLLAKSGKRLNPCITCASMFTTFTHAGEELHACAACRTFWVDHGALDRLRASKNPPPAQSDPFAGMTPIAAHPSSRPPAPPPSWAATLDPSARPSTPFTALDSPSRAPTPGAALGPPAPRPPTPFAALDASTASRASSSLDPPAPTPFAAVSSTASRASMPLASLDPPAPTPFAAVSSTASRASMPLASLDPLAPTPFAALDSSTASRASMPLASLDPPAPTPFAALDVPTASRASTPSLDPPVPRPSIDSSTALDPPEPRALEPSAAFAALGSLPRASTPLASAGIPRTATPLSGPGSSTGMQSPSKSKPFELTPGAFDDALKAASASVEAQAAPPPARPKSAPLDAPVAPEVESPRAAPPRRSPRRRAEGPEARLPVAGAGVRIAVAVVAVVGVVALVVARAETKGDSAFAIGGGKTALFPKEPADADATIADGTAKRVRLDAHGLILDAVYVTSTSTVDVDGVLTGLYGPGLHTERHHGARGTMSVLHGDGMFGPDRAPGEFRAYLRGREAWILAAYSVESKRSNEADAFVESLGPPED